MSRLFWKIFLGFWLTLLITGSAVGWMVWHHTKDRIADLEILVDHPQADQNLNKVAELLASYGLSGLDQFMAQREQRRKHPLPVFIINEQGEDFLGRPVPRMLLNRIYQSLEEPNHQAIKQVTTPQDEKLLVFIPRRDHPIMQRNRIFPANLPILPLLVLLFGSLVFSAGLAFYITKPLRYLRDATQRFAGGDLNSRVMDKMAGRRDEIIDLASDFDYMAEQVQQLVAGQKRLLNDVSHELRSPLARLQLAVALGRQQPDQSEAMMQRVEKEGERLDSLVGELLTLSRLEASVECDEQDYFDINGLLESVINDAKFEAEHQNKKVVFTTTGDIKIKGSIELLRRAVDNVIRNAVFHTPENTEINVDLSHNNSEVIIGVSDNGQGVPEDKLSALFMPFVRFNDHQQNVDVPGHGLGLAIASRAIELNNGTIKAANTKQGGLRITIKLPLL